MTRIKGSKIHMKRRRGILKHTKGYRWGRKSKIKLAKIAKYRAGQFAFDGRRAKKRERRSLWQVKINAAARLNGTTFSRLMGTLKKKGIALDRKVLAEMAMNHPVAFRKLVESIK